MSDNTRYPHDEQVLDGQAAAKKATVSMESYRAMRDWRDTLAEKLEQLQADNERQAAAITRLQSESNRLLEEWRKKKAEMAEHIIRLELRLASLKEQLAQGRSSRKQMYSRVALLQSRLTEALSTIQSAIRGLEERVSVDSPATEE